MEPVANPVFGFFASGMDSLTAIELRRNLQRPLRTDLKATPLFVRRTVESLAAHLIDDLRLPKGVLEELGQDLGFRQGDRAGLRRLALCRGLLISVMPVGPFAQPGGWFSPGGRARTAQSGRGRSVGGADNVAMRPPHRVEHPTNQPEGKP
ncbi:acyl carrier protein [Micromonospora sp. NPDC048871]|uniref:acyl carrier protein n=1 Tax=unclassified Micromonospora TaxID=2617518 RepID=UPI002E0D8B1D|nr:acyl carrier protein [Micromonospora sp. NBC_01739]